MPPLSTSTVNDRMDSQEKNRTFGGDQMPDYEKYFSEIIKDRSRRKTAVLMILTGDDEQMASAMIEYLLKLRQVSRTGEKYRLGVLCFVVCVASCYSSILLSFSAASLPLL